MSTHTPGPWTGADYSTGYEIYGPWPPDGRKRPVVAYLGENRHDDTADANARLIAAAPELLEACKQRRLVRHSAHSAAGREGGMKYYYHAGAQWLNEQTGEVCVDWSNATRRSRSVVEYWETRHGLRPGWDCAAGAYNVERDEN